MKSLHARLLAIAVIAGLGGMVGCGGSHSGSASPTTPGGSYTISGVITAYRGDPLSGMNVGAYPYPSGGDPYGGATMTQTDSEGRYAVSGLSAQKIGLEISSHEGTYATAFKYALGPHDQTVNFVLHPTFSAPPAGGTVSGTISGDEFIAGDDDFGGRCTGTACKVVTFDYNYVAPKVEIRLRWTDGSRRLALYFARGDYYFPPQSPPPPADRYCCSSELVATYTFNADFDRFAIGFEQSAGGPPGPADVQPFELTVQLKQ